MIDLDAVTFLDSSGLAALAELRVAAVAAGKRFALCNVPRSVMRMLTINGLGNMVKSGD